MPLELAQLHNLIASHTSTGELDKLCIELSGKRCISYEILISNFLNHPDMLKFCMHTSSGLDTVVFLSENHQCSIALTLSRHASYVYSHMRSVSYHLTTLELFGQAFVPIEEGS